MFIDTLIVGRSTAQIAMLVRHAEAPDKRARCWAGHDAASEFDVENEFKIRMSGNGEYRRTVDRFAG
jgi:hypothetical protein